MDGSPSSMARTTAAAFSGLGGGVPGHANVRDVIGNFRNEHFGLDAGDRRDAGPNHVGATIELASFLGVIFCHEQLERGQHADHFFLVDLHAAADRVAVRRAVHARARRSGACDRAAIRRLRPRMPLPPENATRSNPIPVYFHRFSSGGTSASRGKTDPIAYPRRARGYSLAGLIGTVLALLWVASVLIRDGFVSLRP